MDTLHVNLTNCWGIQSLEYEFDFRGNNKARAFAVYAPNGMMKSSFAKTFEALSKGTQPQEERFNRHPSCIVTSDGTPIPQEVIYVLKSEVGTRKDNDAISNILVNPISRDRYIELNKDIEEKKDKLINALQKQSKVGKKDIEDQIMKDCRINNFPLCISQILSEKSEFELKYFVYSTIFDDKALEVVGNPEFLSNANKFTKRYQELFDNAGTIYKKGIFNPTKADSAFDALKKQGFFSVGHRIHLHGDKESIDNEELDQKLKEVNALIDDDAQLRQIRKNLAKNAQTQALTDLIESLPPTEVEFLLERLKPENQQQFRKELWTYYFHYCPEATTYLSTFRDSEVELTRIEQDAAMIAPIWTDIVKLFNDRFVDMPFTPSIANHAQAALAKESAKLLFTFKDEDESNTVECLREDPKMKTLSLGEERALNLLYFIFEVEDRKQKQQETLFIIDDVADSFDYKNKHAIILYLKDLCKTDFFHQIILSHNFDFYRAISLGFIHRERCLMANRGVGLISLARAEGINNVFVNMWKNRVSENDTILYATVPFSRNLIEYTRGDEDPDYLKLTSLQHWKSDTSTITIDDYIGIYNGFFGTTYYLDRNTTMVDTLFIQANQICLATTQTGLNLEDKVLMSIAIRMKAEQFMIERIRLIKTDPTYWCEERSQFGKLYEELMTLDANLPERSTLDKVSVTVSSNIHLNSFMYEPILDLSIESLIKLYNEISVLQP
jgi:hypothetical protein